MDVVTTATEQALAAAIITDEPERTATVVAGVKPGSLRYEAETHVRFLHDAAWLVPSCLDGSGQRLLREAEDTIDAGPTHYAGGGLFEELRGLVWQVEACLAGRYSVEWEDNGYVILDQKPTR